MTRDDPPKCPTCGVQLTIKRILIECSNHQKHREETLCSTHLREILGPDPTANVTLFMFLEKSNFVQKKGKPYNFKIICMPLLLL